MKVSIIIPTYNNGKYIETALKAIYTNFALDKEVIVINDGSTDNTLEILENYQKEHNDLIVISTTNEGASNARNKGLKTATGNYIMFCDADDEYESGLIDHMEKHMKDDFDLIVFGRKDYTDHVLTNNCNQHETIKEYHNSLQYSEEIFATGKCTFSVCNKIYKREILEKYHIQFEPSLRYSEDANFNLNYLLYTQNIIEDFEKNYIRHCINGSAMYRQIDSFFFKNEIAIRKWSISIDEKKYHKVLENLCSHYANVAIHRMLYGIDTLSKKEAIHEMKKINNYFKQHQYVMNLNDSFKDKLFSYLFNAQKFKQLYFIFKTMRNIIKRGQK